MDRNKAYILAGRIAAYWEKRGAKVRVWVEKQAWAEEHGGALFAVKSDLVNGLPVPLPLVTLRHIEREARG